MENNKCPNCKGINTRITDHREGRIVCSQCGFVFDFELIDEHNEQRYFTKNCSSNGISNKDLSRTSGPISSFKFGGDLNEIKLIGKKTKNNWENKKYKYSNELKNKNLNEKEKKILKRDIELQKIDNELKKISDVFNINKMIYEAAKEEVIKLYDYGQISIRSSSWKLILGLVLNYTLRIKTSFCFSTEEITSYYKCDLETLKKITNKIFPYLTNSSQILQNEEESKIINLNSENKLEKYYSQLQQDVYLLINKTKIDSITGICDSYDIISIYISRNIFNTEVLPSICLAGGSLIFCIKLYDIQFVVKNKNKDKYDDEYNMNTPEEEKKLICYIAKKCGSGINPDKLKAVYQKMVKNKIVLSDNDKYMDYLDNITDLKESNNYH